MKIKKSAHAAYRVNYHIVWSTRFKKKILKEGVRKYLRLKILEVRKYYPDWYFEAIWSVGYFFATVGINEEVIRKYIERQWREDSGQAQLEF
jgi:putative transposase